MDRLRTLSRSIPPHLRRRTRSNLDLSHPSSSPTSTSTSVSPTPSPSGTSPYASLAPRPNHRQPRTWSRDQPSRSATSDHHRHNAADDRRDLTPRSSQGRTDTKPPRTRTIPTSWKQSGLPPPLLTQLPLILPYATQPTPAQAEFLSAVVLGQRDVFLKEKTGRGKTLALVLAALSTQPKPTRNHPRPQTRTKGPRFLLLLPNTTLLAQVERWFRSFSLPSPPVPSLAQTEEQSGDQKTVWQSIWPPSQPGARAGSIAEAERVIPSIIITTPKALSDTMNRPDCPSWLLPNQLRTTLRTIAMDEPDAIIRPLPGKYDQPVQRHHPRNGSGGGGGKIHPFHRHPPIGVKLLELLLPDRESQFKTTERQNHRIQTIWTSATMNSTLRSFIVKRGWARPRGEGGVVLDYTTGLSGEGEDGMGVHDEVEHTCLVVDPRTGSTRNLNEPGPLAEGATVLNPTDTLDPAHAPGDVHPYIIETLALLWASTPHPGKTIVIPPPGTSVPRFQAALSELECPSVSLDVDSRETAREVDEALAGGEVGGLVDGADEVEADTTDAGQATLETDEPDAKTTPRQTDQNTLLILPRTQLRGIDIQGIKTVYLLGGVGLKPSSSKPNATSGPTSAGTWAEREREYLHWVGRMSRLSGTVDLTSSDVADEPDRMISIVLEGPEVEVMRKLLERRGGAIVGDEEVSTAEEI